MKSDEYKKLTKLATCALRDGKTDISLIILAIRGELVDAETKIGMVRELLTQPEAVKLLEDAE